MRVKQRCGRDARVICWDADSYDEEGKPIIALVMDEDDDEMLIYYYPDGRQYEDQDVESDLMLPQDVRQNVKGYLINGFVMQSVNDIDAPRCPEYDDVVLVLPK